MTNPATWVNVLASAINALDDDCDGYVVMVTDRACAETDAYGPMTGIDALEEADRVCRDLWSAELSDVTVAVVRLHSTHVTWH